MSDSIGNLNGDDENEDNDNDDGQVMAAFAVPLRRKEKKSVDFSRWREVISDNAAGISSNKESNELIVKPKSILLDGVNVANRIDENVSRHVSFKNVVQVEGGVFENDPKEDVEMQSADFSKEVVVEEQEDVSEMNIDDVSTDVWNELHWSERVTYKNPNNPTFDNDNDNMMESFRNSGHGNTYFGLRHEPNTLDSQIDDIDAENRARLQKMSADEIVEAQDELKKRLNPSLLKKLRERGQNKSKKQKSSASDVRIGGQVGNLQDENLTDKPTFPRTETSNNAIKTDSVKTLVDSPLLVSDSSCSPWDSWSKRVESVRELRFSLEGNVIDISGRDSLSVCYLNMLVLSQNI